MEENMQTEQTVEQENCNAEQAEKKTNKKCNKKAQEQIDKALAEAEECKRKWYAVTAEYENYRRRTQNQSAQRYQEVSAYFFEGSTKASCMGLTVVRY